MRVTQHIFLGLFLVALMLSSITAMAFSWLQVGAGAAAGAVTGAIVGTAVPGIGTLVGAGAGALSGAIASIVDQLLFSAPSTSSCTVDWLTYQRDVYNQTYAESVAVADNEISIVNVMKESSTVYIITAQKYEQVNYNINVTPTTPNEFYSLLVGTGFLHTAIQEIAAPQELWVEMQSQINSLNNLISAHTNACIKYNVNPGSTFKHTFTTASTSVKYFLIVQGNVTICSHCAKIICENGEKVCKAVQGTCVNLTTGYYVLGYTTCWTIWMNPYDGVALVFEVCGNSYSPCPMSYNEPTVIELYNKTSSTAILSNSLPTPSISPIYASEDIAIAMLGAAETEYTTLKALGFENASQIPPSFQLPIINLNVPLNFTNVTSVEEYNLLMSEYLQYLLAINKTLSQLESEGKLQGLYNLTFDFSSPLQTYGEEGGFIFIGTIHTPYGTLPYGTYLIQPYGGPLTLSSTGGIIPSGGAIAYTLIKLGNGYVLGNYTILPPGSTLCGKVLNPGTLYPVTQPQNITPLPSVGFSNPISVSLSSYLSEIEQYLLSHPLVLIITVFFALLIIVGIIKAISG